jgi:hypothetical protein
MGRIVQQRGIRGSQMWLQQFVETSPARLDEAIGLGHLEWLSPLADDDYSEYRDGAFLERLGVDLARRTLASFWPSGGPCWDGLARTASGECVLVEAKAHVAEMASSCAAASPASLATIRSALAETRRWMGVHSGQDWCDGFYQYANRLAHGYLLNELNAVPTALVFVYFLGDGDMGGPTSEGEWAEAISRVHEHLGVGLPPRWMRDAFVDVREAG